MIVLRAHPETIVERFVSAATTIRRPTRTRNRKRSMSSSASASRARDGVRHEIETTDRDADEVAQEIQAVVTGEREPSAGLSRTSTGYDAR